MGEKTGWTYITITQDIAHRIKPGIRKSFRVKGKLDDFPIKGVSLIPTGSGDFILPVNALLRKGIRKMKGDQVKVQLEVDSDVPEISSELMICLEEESAAKNFFNSLPKSQQNYFSKWIESAKTETTKAQRIARAISGLQQKMTYPEIIRYYKNKS